MKNISLDTINYIQNTWNSKQIAKLKELLCSGYRDLGWANSDKAFTHKGFVDDELDCSIYRFRGIDVVYIDHTHKEVLHVDMSD